MKFDPSNGLDDTPRRRACRVPWLHLLVLSFAPAALFAKGVEEAPIGEAVERHLTDAVPLTQWTQQPDDAETAHGDKIETRETLADELETIKLSNLVEPIRFESGVAQIPPETVESLATILERMKHRINVRLHLIGHADDRPLSAELAAVYGDNVGLSRERAGEVAEYFQTALSLPPESVSYDWAGETQPAASNETEAGRAQNRRVEVEVWYDEVQERVALEEFLVPHEIRRVKVCRMETVCKLRYVEGHRKRARIQNLVAPLYYDDESIDVTADFIERIGQALDNLSDKQNVVVKFVGFTDSAPLLGRVERIYGTHVGLSKARARRVALEIQDQLGLPTTAIASDGKGSAAPLGSNETAQGRALNRRIEAEFWYDDPLADLPDEPQLCPESAGAELVAREYDPPWGDIAPIGFEDGQPVVPADYGATLERAMADVADRQNVRLRFVGYTENERLARRTAAVYGDDIGLSASRARRAMEKVNETLGLEPDKLEFEGRGYVHSPDVVNAGFVRGDTSHVAVQVVYDDLAILDDYEGVDITRITRELTPENPLGLNLMRITVDGKPIDDPKRSSSDIQRCTDVAMQQASIRFGFDNLRSSPRLSATASPSRIAVSRRIDFETLVDPVYFRMYTNYSNFIDRAEVRIFDNGQSLESEPLAVVPIDLDGIAKWNPPAAWFKGPAEELAYVVRAYGKTGNFDETRPQPLWFVYDDVEKPDPDAGPDVPPADENLLAAYGENTLGLHNIGLGSGTVSVRGTGVPEGHDVYVAGRPVPVDEGGNFVTEEILPAGAHTVEVAMVDEEGAGEVYLRDLELEARDWFYVGMADVTVSETSASGPVDLFTGDNTNYEYDSTVDGRLAFFVNGKFGDHWKLMASADTREGSVDTLFSNFMDKNPDSLFRRIDPDYYYPTFGDDGTVEELAPTMGKFFVRLGHGNNYGQWGNFKVGYMNNELAQVDRGLYGGTLHWESKATTGFGERRFVFDAFAAEPGTIGSREEFRGTGGSLYFLRVQDIVPGSERVRIEIRDKASGIVTGVVNLTPVLDYDVDYLQGRVLLSEPLASTVSDDLLVRSNSIDGDEAYLVVRYEYTPGFDEPDSMSVGGQGHYWFGDHVKLGVTSNVNEETSLDTSLNAADLTLRFAANTWLKVQQAESEGLVSLPTFSADGGFDFTSYDANSFVNASAGASRVDLSLSSNDIVNFGNAQLTLYAQEVEAGYSAPGLTTLRDTENWGGELSVPIRDNFSVVTKMDSRIEEQGLETEAQEINLGYQISYHWDIQAGYRLDNRIDRSPIVSLTQDEGERADAVLQIGYDSKDDWNTYAFVQDTMSVTGGRRENSRAGVGGSYRFSDKFTLDAEVSDGDLGTGGRVGTNYMHSERTSVYLAYALDNERTEYGSNRRVGGQGSLTTGIKSRLGESTSVFLEERYQHSEMMTGLTHATGISFAPTDAWQFGINSDIGTLVDAQTGAETERVAAGLSVGVNWQGLQIASAVEYRMDEAEQANLATNERTTWLFKNTFKYQVNPGTRFVGKFNHSTSDSSLGTFYQGGFTEAVVGYGYRPVTHDRLNTFVKYTYFYNVPTTGQVTLQNTPAEFVQKSHIAAIDVTYDVTRRFTLGGKYAYRLGQVSLDRVDTEFFDNNANLYVVRGDYRLGDNWELLGEARLLDMPDLSERRSGALFTISRYVGDHLKVGLGYNFTDFSDDLTDLSYDHQGFFLNLTGSM